MFYQNLYSILSFVKNKLAYNEDRIRLLSPNLDMLANICIVNQDLSPSLMHIRSGTFFTGYKSICSTTKDSKVLNILSISSPYFLE